MEGDVDWTLFFRKSSEGLRSMETGLTGLMTLIDGLTENQSLEEAQAIIKAALEIFSPDRLLRIAHAMRYQLSLQEIQEITKYDMWYLEQIKAIVESEERLKQDGVPQDKLTFLQVKKEGFSDARIAELTGTTEQVVRDKRHELGCRPVC